MSFSSWWWGEDRSLVTFRWCLSSFLHGHTKDGDTPPKNSASLKRGLRLLSAQEVPLGLALSLCPWEAWCTPKLGMKEGPQEPPFFFSR